MPHLISPAVRKILPLEKVVNIANAFRSERIIVTTNGCFDILHVGHVRALQESKEQGDLLIVGVDSNKAVRKRKGEGRPINSHEERAEILAALECVDYITIYDFDDCRPFIEAIRPNVHTNGPEYGSPKEWIEYPALVKYNIKPYTYTRHKDLSCRDYSTTNLLRRMRGSEI